jgi:hypothetical protein
MGRGHLLGLGILFAAGAAAAQSHPSLRLRDGAPALGLQVGTAAPRVPCGNFSISCDAATLPLYTSEGAPRSLSMQLEYPRNPLGVESGRSPGVSLNLVGQAGLPGALGVYGRIGTTLQRANANGLNPVIPGDGGVTYGVGLSWDFSRSGSAALGLDSYDLRGLGDGRELRTSLGLQWRY